MKYIELKHNPPTLEVVKDAREVIFTTVSAMCDNKHTLRLKKNSDGEFKLSGMGNSISNWQMKFEKHEIEWMADMNTWEQVIKMINTGTSVIETVKSR